MANIFLDFRLLDLSIELHALEDHLQIIENHVKELARLEEERVSVLARENNWDFDDPEFDFARQECNHRIQFLFPRIFRGPFLVTLYAVFEAGVTEISRLIQSRQKRKLSINDLKGDFLDRATKYFKHIIEFDLPMDSKWQHIRRLSEIRNALAHTNGRIDLLNANVRDKIHKWENDGTGIYTDMNFILVNEEFANKTFLDVNAYLRSLIERYKEWDNNQDIKST